MSALLLSLEVTASAHEITKAIEMIPNKAHNRDMPMTVPEMYTVQGRGEGGEGEAGETVFFLCVCVCVVNVLGLGSAYLWVRH